MEENHNDQPKDQTVAPTPGGVMDVQSPQPQHVGTAPELDSPIDFGDAPDTAKPPVAHDAPKDDHPPHIDEPTKTTLNSAALHKDDEVHPLLAAHAQRRPIPFVAVIIAIVVAVGLAGLAVFVYQSSKDSTKPEGDHTQTETTQTTPATATDVDDTSKEVDSTISSVNDTTDLPETDLTDQSLGL